MRCRGKRQPGRHFGARDEVLKELSPRTNVSHHCAKHEISYEVLMRCPSKTMRTATFLSQLSSTFNFLYRYAIQKVFRKIGCARLLCFLYLLCTLLWIG